MNDNGRIGGGGGHVRGGTRRDPLRGPIGDLREFSTVSCVEIGGGGSVGGPYGETGGAPRSALAAVLAERLAAILAVIRGAVLAAASQTLFK